MFSGQMLQIFNPCRHSVLPTSQSSRHFIHCWAAEDHYLLQSASSVIITIRSEPGHPSITLYRVSESAGRFVEPVLQTALSAEPIRLTECKASATRSNR